MFYKPYGVLSQFTKEVPGHITLADFLTDIPSDVYPVGRLDKDSEGLLLLTNDKSLIDLLLNPKNKHPRSYWVQVDGEITHEAIQKLSDGVTIKHKRKHYHTLPTKVTKIPTPNIPERIPPIRYRKSIPTSWIKITLVEGKNRQVRKMCANVGFPVLRLIRCGINKIQLTSLHPGESFQITKNDIL